MLYAISVPIDIMSTSSLRSNIRAMKAEKEESIVTSIDSKLYSFNSLMPLPFLKKEINILELVSGLSVQQFRWLVAEFSTQKPEFKPRKVHAESVIDKVALRQVSVSVLEFSLSSYHSTNAPF